MIPPRVRPLDLDDLDSLPAGCRGCMFWQSTHGRRGGGGHDPQGQDAWWRAVQLDWGVPGRAIWIDGVLVAYALFAPVLHVQRVRSMSIPISEDAIVLATMWTAEDDRHAGHAKHLLQAVARDTLAHGHTAIEAYAVPGTSDGQCGLDAAFLEAVGFEEHRRAFGLSLYRMDLERTVRWPHAVGHAIGEALSNLQGKERAPRPALEVNQAGRRSDDPVPG